MFVICGFARSLLFGTNKDYLVGHMSFFAVQNNAHILENIVREFAFDEN